jgi:hypothetical protein
LIIFYVFIGKEDKRANEEIEENDDEDDVKEDKVTNEIEEIYKDINNNNAQAISSSQATTSPTLSALAEHLTNISEARKKTNDGQEKTAQAFKNDL